ncbi:hypothetical protein SBY92_003722 [Candida maltosa Xu316]
MLYYINQELSFQQLLNELTRLNNVSGYILISDSQLYETYQNCIKLSLRNIHNLRNFKVVLIESWVEVEQFISQIERKCLVVLYGIIKSFVEIGHDDVVNHHDFLKYHQFCGWELNKLFHKMFVRHLEIGFDILMNDSLGPEETGEPLIWGINIPNIREKLHPVSSQQQISLRVIFIKWFQVIKEIHDMK